ncbi:MAG: hydroxyisourate hydrolase [Rhodobacteraceae bacterium]|jgi:5-hydroxyisourate hydrolase|nr:hydroxyisourate hydrolase [Paracoccaceae bacterium]
MVGRLTTHVLDTARGRPAAGMRIVLFRIEGEPGSDIAGVGRRKLAEAVTNGDGRTEGPMLEGSALAAGRYELVFMAGDYLRASGQGQGEILFLDEIPIRFGIPDAGQHYHVPLLISPFAYSTYRGS